MSSETSLFGKETVSESPLLTECHLVNPEEACRDIVNSIKHGEVIILAARVSAGMGKISVEATTVNVEALFTGLERVVEAYGLFEPNSPSRLEARGMTNHPSSSGSDQSPLTVVFQLSGSNRVDSGHFFLETQ